MAKLRVLEGIHVEESLLPGSPEEEFLILWPSIMMGPGQWVGGNGEDLHGCCINNDSLTATSIGRTSADGGQGEWTSDSVRYKGMSCWCLGIGWLSRGGKGGLEAEQSPSRAYVVTYHTSMVPLSKVTAL